MVLHTKIKQIREFFGKTQDEIAQKLNITAQAYSRIERGETALDTKRLEDIAQALGVKTKDIYEFDERKIFVKQENNETQDNATVHFYLNINETAQNKYVEHLEKTVERQQEEIAFLREQLKRLLADK